MATMNPALRHIQRAKLRNHSSGLEKITQFDWSAAQTQSYGGFVPENFNRPLHSSDSGEFETHIIASPEPMSIGSRQLRLRREALLDLNLVQTSHHDEKACSHNNDPQNGSREYDTPLDHPISALEKTSKSSNSKRPGVSHKLSLSSEPKRNRDVNEESNDKVSPSSTLGRRRPLVNRRATPDFDATDPDENLEGRTKLAVSSQDISRITLEPCLQNVPLMHFSDLAINGSIVKRPGRNNFLASWNSGSVKQRTTLHDSEDLVDLKVSIVGSFDVSCIADLKQEARIAVQIRHPNTCQLKGVVADAEFFGLAYECCEGGPLSSLISDKKKRYNAISIAKDIVNGMAHLHSRRIIHRNLKPSNILLTSDNRAKVAEFDMSVVDAGQQLTAEIGTYRYMAPEVIRHEPYTFTADVYSFGVCLWELLTRGVPFATQTPLQAAYSVAEGCRPVIPDKVPDHIQKIVTACWDQGGSNRPIFSKLVQIMDEFLTSSSAMPNMSVSSPKEKLDQTERNNTFNTTLGPPVVVGAYLSHSDLCTGGNGIGLEI